MLLRSMFIVLMGLSVVMLSACGNSIDDEIDQCQEECNRINQDLNDGRICLGCQITSNMAAPQADSTTARSSVALAFAIEADLNADGIADLVIPVGNADQVSVLLNNADETRQDWQTYAVGQRPEALSTADLNDDGVLDIVVSNSGAKNMTVLLGRGDGTFEPVQEWPPRIE
jgi:hypothetical protein